ncbi:MAG: hypothetical protein JOZ18_08515, partial [Chloroflexi bacterium]|nr:hypothetical protein [Chloroflexota bacterium]
VAANYWARTRSPHLSEAPSTLRQAELSVLARVYLANQQFEECLQLLQHLLRLAEEAQNIGQIIALLSLHALAFSTGGERARAVVILTRALSLGERGGYVQTFVREGVAMKSLLETFQAAQRRGELPREHSVSPDYVERMLAIFAETCGKSTDLPSDQKPVCIIEQSERGSAQSTVTPLSMRELEVLRLMSEGFSNREIAQRLVLAEGTVKTHARRIYAKLEAKNRLYAIRLAKEMQLL